MTRALGLKMPESAAQAEFDSAVSLMPDLAHSASGSKAEELRFLLNFPVTLDPAWIHSGLGKAAMWEGQFNGTRDKNLHLHWPGTIKGKGTESPWWKNGEIIERGCTCISVDLGQRTAGAWALLHVMCWDPRKGNEPTKRPVREIGFDGERTGLRKCLRLEFSVCPGKIKESRPPTESPRWNHSASLAAMRSNQNGRKAANRAYSLGRKS